MFPLQRSKEWQNEFEDRVKTLAVIENEIGQSERRLTEHTRSAMASQIDRIRKSGLAEVSDLDRTELESNRLS